jgi:hypothetical protein
MNEELSNGLVTYDANHPCSGAISFETSVSNPAVAPVGRELKTSPPKSLAFTISGQKKDVVDLISSSPGTIAPGTAHKQDK